MYAPDLVKPIWDITEAVWADYPNNSRYALWAGAVFDKETGLVWEETTSSNRTTLSAAIQNSFTKIVASRKGWRLPTIEELLSIVNPDGVPTTLDGNNPFQNVKTDSSYWTLSSGVATAGGDQELVWVYNFGTPGAIKSVAVAQTECYSWLVRGCYGHNCVFGI
jgi:Protein of unknown function (DUF1566)